MKRPIRLRPQAENEFLAAYAWYETKQRRLGDQFRDEVQAAFDLIAERPHAFAKPRLGPRIAPVRRFPYLIVYENVGDHIAVFAIFHAKRDPGNLTRRLRR